MQNYTTILGIIDIRQRKISYDDCRNRYGVGNSTITLIMNRFHECGKDLSALKQMSPSEVEELFYPPVKVILPMHSASVLCENLKRSNTSKPVSLLMN